MASVDVVYLKDRNGNYTNGHTPVSQRWEAMKNTDEAQYWLYTGAQRGAVFSYEFNRMTIPKEDISGWKQKGYITRDW